MKIVFFRCVFSSLHLNVAILFGCFLQLAIRACKVSYFLSNSTWEHDIVLLFSLTFFLLNILINYVFLAATSLAINHMIFSLYGVVSWLKSTTLLKPENGYVKCAVHAICVFLNVSCFEYAVSLNLHDCTYELAIWERDLVSKMPENMKNNIRNTSFYQIGAAAVTPLHRACRSRVSIYMLISALTPTISALPHTSGQVIQEIKLVFAEKSEMETYADHKPKFTFFCQGLPAEGEVVKGKLNESNRAWLHMKWEWTPPWVAQCGIGLSVKMWAFDDMRVLHMKHDYVTLHRVCHERFIREIVDHQDVYDCRWVSPIWLHALPCVISNVSDFHLGRCTYKLYYLICIYLYPWPSTWFNLCSTTLLNIHPYEMDSSRKHMQEYSWKLYDPRRSSKTDTGVAHTVSQIIIKL